MIFTLHLDSALTVGLILIGIISFSAFLFQLGRKYQHKNPHKVSGWMD